ncbi:hypothetical protein A9264_07375 [Vibrio sp. UCD-FRSSP16_10]|uniref:lipocalin-like domain-containing protein n=1 Tax=unclassified Vibrio TaxID=2614977 RepID=UPI00080065E0|nr:MULTISPECIES: lipocalin-like domain-containing protein [unclassified Vibrio]OBT13477.1 hypothetical protein A9264_07375 [Vibrio sp. UCD-FRSSP16_10]OBT17986.1 hypothetical protein A9260_01365 [Vibrio sp. UCD-FRSSP16_30]
MPKILKKYLIVLVAFIVTLIGVGLVVQHYLEVQRDKAYLVTQQKLAAESTFEPVLPDRKVSFPADFTVHPKYQHEVWRFIATLKDDKGEEYLVQWFLFRIAMSEVQGVSWESPQIYTSQAIVTTPEQVFLEQRFARGGIGIVGIRQRPYQLSIDNWAIRSFSNSPIPGRVSISTEQFKVQLTTELTQPYIPLGDRGYQITHDLVSRAFYGYSAPYVDTSGTITIGNQMVGVSGKASFSQVWGTDIIGTGQSGYAHIMLRLEDGRVLSVVKTQYKDHVQPYVFGNLFTPDGGHVALNSDQIDMHFLSQSTLANGKILPLKWAINVPDFDIFLTARTARYNQWANLSIPSWSGRMKTTGNIKANGYMQLIGY